MKTDADITPRPLERRVGLLALDLGCCSLHFAPSPGRKMADFRYVPNPPLRYLFKSPRYFLATWAFLKAKPQNPAMRFRRLGISQQIIIVLLGEPYAGFMYFGYDGICRW